MSRPDPLENKDKDAFVPPYLRRSLSAGQVESSAEPLPDPVGHSSVEPAAPLFPRVDPRTPVLDPNEDQPASSGRSRSPRRVRSRRANGGSAVAMSSLAPAGATGGQNTPLDEHMAGVFIPPPAEDAPPERASWRGWRWTPVFVGLAVLAWLVALSLLAMGPDALQARVSSPRLTFIAAWVVAAVVTFVPLEFRLGLPGLTWQGTAGWTLLGYTLAFVPPPRGWLLDLPDLPTYLIFLLALLYAIASATLPLTCLLGRWLYSRRMHQLDLRRARRQAYEVGMLAVSVLALAALRVLSPLTGLLLLAVFILVETLFLSQVAPDG